MTKQIKDKELENIDGGMDEISDPRLPGPIITPPIVPPIDGPTGGATGGGGTFDDLQQHPDRDPS